MATWDPCDEKKRLQDEWGPPMALACLVRVPWEEEGTEWSPGAFLRKEHFFQMPRWITRSQIRARARWVRIVVKLLSSLNENVQTIIVSFIWKPRPNDTCASLFRNNVF